MEQSESLEGRLILIADDSDDMWRLSQLFLRRAGACTERAINGLDAVEKAGRREYAAILMDVQMPVMDGLEATRILRASGFLNPILAFTTNDHYEHAAKSLEAGCDEHITKPVSAQNLIAKLANYCDTMDLEHRLGIV